MSTLRMATPRQLRLVLSICVITAACFAVNTASAAPTEARTALVIGNSDYRSSPLVNPRNDARDLGEVLKKLGFEVEVVIDQNKEQMTEAIFEFGDRLRKRGGVGFFYYAGHGMEVDGENYLIPVGADIPSERYVKLRGVPMGEVTTGLAAARNKMNIVVLDACRNNPFARSWRSGSRGLAVMSTPAETLIAYATEPGSVAADGVGTRNSPYAQALIASIQEPGVRLVDVFRRTRAKVRNETGGAQVPWQSDNLTTEAFYFVPASPRIASVSPRRQGADFSLDELDAAAKVEEEVRRDWDVRLERMESAFEEVQAYQGRRVSDALKVQAWEKFARAYSENDPYSSRDDQLREKARQKIAALQPKYASLVVRSNVSGDQVSIDGQKVGSTGPRAHQLDPGRHTIRVEKDDYEIYESMVRLGAGERRVLNTSLTARRDPSGRSTWLVRGNIRLYLREGAGTQFKILGEVESMDRMEVLAGGETWTRVRTTEGKAGWIPTGYLTSCEGAELPYVLGSIQLNLRAGAGTQFKIMGLVETNERVEVLARGETWTRVRTTEGKTGWIPAGYLATEWQDLGPCDPLGPP